METQISGPSQAVTSNAGNPTPIHHSSTTQLNNTSLNLEGLDKECSALAGLFQHTVNDMKVRFQTLF